MSLQTSFDILSRVVEQYESGGRTVRHVEARTDGEGELRVSMEIPVSLCAASDDRVRSALTPETATLTEGGLCVEFSTSPLARLPGPTAAAVSASEEAVRVVDEGVVLAVELSIDPAEADHVEGLAQAESDSPPETVPVAPESDDGPVNGTESDTAEADDSAPSDADTVRSAESDDGADATDDRASELAAARDDSVPPYDDTEYLARLYEVCDTFTEMSDLIEMDVSSETVRRYMIEAGVHDPASYDVVEESDDPDRSGQSEPDGGTRTVDRDGVASPTDEANSESKPVDDRSANGSTESGGPSRRGDAEAEDQALLGPDDPMDGIPDEQLVTDGSGLPSGIDLRDVAEAVVESVTVYQVQRRLGLERQRTQELLRQLNLIDLATGRASRQAERSVSYEEVAARIRDRAPSEA